MPVGAVAHTRFRRAVIIVAVAALIPVMTDYPPIAIGIYVVRPPDKRVPRKIAVLTELLIEHFHRA